MRHNLNIEIKYKPSNGEKWYVKHNGAQSLVTYEVIDVTDRTVLVRKENSCVFGTESRYKLDDLEFVERIKG